MRWIAWGEETVPVSGRSGAQSSVASTRLLHNAFCHDTSRKVARKCFVVFI